MRKILQGNDDIWKMQVRITLLNTDDLLVADELREEVKRIANCPTDAQKIPRKQGCGPFGRISLFSGSSTLFRELLITEKLNKI